MKYFHQNSQGSERRDHPFSLGEIIFDKKILQRNEEDDHRFAE